jgi:hypothetical protein
MFVKLSVPVFQGAIHPALTWATEFIRIITKIAVSTSGSGKSRSQ